MMSLLLTRLTSGVSLPLLTSPEMVEPDGVSRSTFQTIEKTAFELAARLGAVHETGPVPPIGGVVHIHPPGAEIDTNVESDTGFIVNEGFTATSGPPFATVTVKVRFAPAGTVNGEALIMAEMSATPVTTMHAENSEVLPDGSVAVAVMTEPTGTAGRLANAMTLPEPSVIADVEPR